jgi:hypothetical protein
MSQSLAPTIDGVVNGGLEARLFGGEAAVSIGRR